MPKLSHVNNAIQQVKPHVIGIKFPKRTPWTPIIPKSGPVIPESILSLANAPPAAAPTASNSAPKSIPAPVFDVRGRKPRYTDIPVTNIRNVIAKRLSESKQTVPHQYSSAKINVGAANELRKMLGKTGFKVSMNDMIIKAVSIAMKKVPELNAVWTGDEARQLEQVDMCIAVATEQGLFAPCLKKIDQFGLSGINTYVKDIASRAREGKLKPDELSGGGFSVSNLGMFGITEFTAVINPPQAGILAVGGVETSFTQNGPLNEMTVTLSADGRSVDLDAAFRFVEEVKAILESPQTMMLQ